MYNVHLADRQAEHKRAESETRRRDRAWHKKRLNVRDSMASNYRNRVEKFLISMVQTPITVEPPVIHPHSMNYSFRESPKKPFVGSSWYRYAESSEQDRIKREAEVIDTTTVEPMKKWLRPRDEEKEINP